MEFYRIVLAGILVDLLIALGIHAAAGTGFLLTYLVIKVLHDQLAIAEAMRIEKIQREMMKDMMMKIGVGEGE